MKYVFIIFFSILFSACSKDKVASEADLNVGSNLKIESKNQSQENQFSNGKVSSKDDIQPKILKDPEIGEYVAFKLRYKVVLDAVSRAGLKDPDSALIKYSPLTKAVHLKVKSNGDKEFEFGDFVSVSVNAKNSFGGYTGYQTTKYFLRDKDAKPLTVKDSDFFKEESECGKSLQELKTCFSYPDKWQPVQLRDPYEKRK